MKPAPRQPQVCAVCGGPAPFGFGPPLRRDRIWTCAAHKQSAARVRDDRAAAKPARPAPQGDRAPDLFGGA